jgi:Zn-dependent M16 (insulinase) family peptidase
MKNFLYKKLFPDNAYGYNAHGDTADVVSLDETEVMSYYRAHYHPSNGQAFCYGPRDYVDQCLDLLDSVVSYFDEDIQLRTKSKVGWQELMKLEEPHEAVAYPSYQNSTDFRYAESWVLNDQNMDSRTEVAWFLISDLLVGSPAALLSKEVANLNLGDDVIGGLDHTLQQWTFTVGVSGISDEDKVSVAQDAIRNLLLKTAEEGFSDEAMKASLNKVDMNVRSSICCLVVEFAKLVYSYSSFFFLLSQLREQSGGDEPLGVKHFRAIINKWTYDFDAKLPLLYSKVFSQLKEGIEKDGQGFILELMTKFLVDNNHKTEVEMFPSVNLAIEWENVSLTNGLCDLFLFCESLQRLTVPRFCVSAARSSLVGELV